MKKHPLLFNFILTMAIQIGVYLIEIFEVQIIEPLLQALGVRSEGIMAPTEVVRFFVMRVVLVKWSQVSSRRCCLQAQLLFL